MVDHQLRQRLLARAALLDRRKQATSQRRALLQWAVLADQARQHLDAVIC